VSVAERVRFHAALGDPSRLALVDLLVLDDMSPGDLARRLGLLTNLVAHHLRVLEQAGILRRTRSEGDGRRSYVRFRADHPMLVALDLVPQLGPELRGSRRVVFVCTQNSALAAGRFGPASGKRVAGAVPRNPSASRCEGVWVSAAPTRTLQAPIYR
jgi:DNA-binding transcriptional ArsR family regulator